MGTVQEVVGDRPIVPCGHMEVMKVQCKTCPFRDDGCIQVREQVIERTLAGVNQTCHTTGAKFGKQDTHLCRGARDFQLKLFHGWGMIAEPTDEAWDAKRKELNV